MKPRNKTATLPSLRVDPDLRADVEAVLGEGESLSAFMEDAIRREVNSRRVRQEFIDRGLGALAGILAGAPTRPAEDVYADVEHIIETAERRRDAS